MNLSLRIATNFSLMKIFAIGRAHSRYPLCIGALLVLALATNAGATTFTVTNSSDSGMGSLRQAILDANAQQVTGGQGCAPHSIVFAIPGSGLHTIRPLSQLPKFNIPITVDGYSQPGSSFNTLNEGSNAVLTIELDGSLSDRRHHDRRVDPGFEFVSRQHQCDPWFDHQPFCGRRAIDG